jgi:hypothetical protein
MNHADVIKSVWAAQQKQTASTIKRQPGDDEPDRFRRAVERWTVRVFLILVAVTLGFELLAWSMVKIRRSIREIVGDSETTRPINRGSSHTPLVLFPLTVIQNVGSAIANSPKQSPRTLKLTSDPRPALEELRAGLVAGATEVRKAMPPRSTRLPVKRRG